MQMFVRTAVEKIEGTLKEFEKRKQLEAAAEERKKKDSPPPLVFTDKEISVKPLKGDGAKVFIHLSSRCIPSSFFFPSVLDNNVPSAMIFLSGNIVIISCHEIKSAL